VFAGAPGIREKYEAVKGLVIGRRLALAGALQAAPSTADRYSQNVPMTSQEKKNLDFILKWWREVIYAGHLELAPGYQAENYIQHNPNVPTGQRDSSNSSKKSAGR